MKLTIRRLKGGRVKVRRSYTHVDEETFEADADGHLIEPKCPGCGTGVLVQRCPWERGGDCARHDISDLYKEALKSDTSTHAFKPYGYQPELCRHCRKPESEHEDGEQ